MIPNPLALCNNFPHQMWWSAPCQYHGLGMAKCEPVSAGRSGRRDGGTQKAAIVGRATNIPHSAHSKPNPPPPPRPSFIQGNGREGQRSGDRSAPTCWKGSATLWCTSSGASPNTLADCGGAMSGPRVREIIGRNGYMAPDAGPQPNWRRQLQTENQPWRHANPPPPRTYTLPRHHTALRHASTTHKCIKPEVPAGKPTPL